MRYLPALLLFLIATLTPHTTFAQAQQDSVSVTFTEYLWEVDGTCAWEIVGSHSDPVGNGADSDYTYPFNTSNTVFDGYVGPTPSVGQGGIPGDSPGQRITFLAIFSYFPPSNGACDPSGQRDFWNNLRQGIHPYAYYAAAPNIPPEACFVAEIGTEPLQVDFNASCSDDEDGQVTGYSWDFDGDGVADGGGGPQVSFTYPERGSYTAALVVTDNDGARSDAYTAAVEPQAPDFRFEVSLEPFDSASGKKASPQDEDPPGFSLGDEILVRIKISNIGDYVLEDIRVNGDEEGIEVFSTPPNALEFVEEKQQTFGRSVIDRLEPGEQEFLLYAHEVVLAVQDVGTVSVGEVTAITINPFTGERSTRTEVSASCEIGNKQGAHQDMHDNQGCAKWRDVSQFIVNSTGDAPLGTDEDGNSLETCSTGETITRDGQDEDECTLRAALEQANRSDKLDFIHFDIPTEDAGCTDQGCAITVDEALPEITAPAAVQGTTQPGYNEDEPKPVITVVSGGSAAVGLHLATDGNNIEGLRLKGFSEAGIQVEGGRNTLFTNEVLENEVGILIESGSENAIGSVSTPEGATDPVCVGNHVSGGATAGIVVREAAANTTILCSSVGVSPEVAGSRPNETGILIEGSANNMILKNEIFGNTGIGVHVKGAGATGNQISENIIGRLPQLGTEANLWGVVIESASGNTIGDAAAQQPGKNVITGNTRGNILIFSQDQEAPANNNTIRQTYVGTDLEGYAITNPNSDQAWNGNSGYGIAISGWASNNEIGSTADGLSVVVAPHDGEPDIAIYGTKGPSAVGNKIVSGLIGFGLQYMMAANQENKAIYKIGENIDIQGAKDIQIGVPEGPGVITGSANTDAIYIYGRTGSELVNVEGRYEESDIGFDPPVGGTRVQNVLITNTSTIIEGTGENAFNSRNGITIIRSQDVQIGPDVKIEVCDDGEPGFPGVPKRRYGILMASTDESTITETIFQGCFDVGGLTVIPFGPTRGIRMSTSSRNSITYNTFSGLSTAVEIRGEGPPREGYSGAEENSSDNVITDNLFGIVHWEGGPGVGLPVFVKNNIGIALRANTEDTRISSNHFDTNDIGIDLKTGTPGDFEMPGPVRGTIIEDNVFGVTQNRGPIPFEGIIAIRVQEAIGTRIGGSTVNSTRGGNTIRKYGTGVSVIAPAKDERGTSILGNAITTSNIHNGKDGIFVYEARGPGFNLSNPFPRRPVTGVLNLVKESGTLYAEGFIWGPPDRAMLLQFFRSPRCAWVNEGQEYLKEARVRTGILGLARFRVSVPLSGFEGLTVTATDRTTRQTSDFSPCFSLDDAAETGTVRFDPDNPPDRILDIIIDDGPFKAGSAAVDTLFVTAYPGASPADRFSGQAAVASSGSIILPRSVMGRYWRIETPPKAEPFTIGLCLDTASLSENEATEAVIVQRSPASGGQWIPHDTQLETDDGKTYACTAGVLPSGEFSFGSGEEAVLAPAMLQSPENNATDVDLSTMLAWQPLPEATTYDLQIALDAGFATLLVDSTGIDGTAILPDSLARSLLHYWRVRGVTASGEAGPWSSPYRFVSGDTGVGVEDEAAEVPETFALEANYPNPFNPQTTIGFSLPQTARVRLVVFDILGREVTRLVDGMLPGGRHETVFEAGALPSGVYLYRLEADGFVQARRMLLIK